MTLDLFINIGSGTNIDILFVGRLETNSKEYSNQNTMIVIRESAFEMPLENATYVDDSIDSVSYTK